MHADCLAHDPVGGGQGVGVVGEVVGSDAIVLPELHAVDAIGHMAGAEKEDVVVGVIIKKGLVLELAVRPHRQPVQEAEAGCDEGEKGEDVDQPSDVYSLFGRGFVHNIDRSSCLRMNKAFLSIVFLLYTKMCFIRSFR